MTKTTVEAGKLLNIEVIDHIIIGSGGRFESLQRLGLGGLVSP
jgi:DNA repair protein RadC